MKRRLLLLVGSFVALMAIFLIYHAAASRSAKSVRPANEVAAPNLRPESPPGKTDIPGGEDIFTVTRDAQGRLEQVYRVKKWTKQPDGSFLMIEPRMEFYNRRGQRIIARGDRGHVFVEEVGNAINIRHGELTGNVSVLVDRNARSDVPAENRPDDPSLIRIKAEDLRFENDPLSIQTQGRVSLVAAEVEIYGRGLAITWNDKPRELRLLRLDRGEKIILHNVPSEFAAVTLPGATSQPASAPAPTPTPVSNPTPSPQPEALAAAGMTETRPAERKAMNIYQATLESDGGEVLVDAGNRRMTGAERISITLELDKAFDEGTEDSRGASGEPTTNAASASASSAASQPATRPAGQSVEIRWSGPLVMKPVGRTETPQNKRYIISAEGSRVVLSDEKTRATCRTFTFRHPEKTGELVGDARTPAQLDLSTGEKIACERMDFSSESNVAHLNGPGYMLRPAQKLPAGTPPSSAPPTDRISWQESVVAKFGAPPPGARSRTQSQPYLKEVVFRGKVDLSQAAGDYVRCDELQVYMGIGPDTKAYPTQTVAIGNVQAHQEGSDISAGKVTVVFDSSPTSQPSKTISGVRPVSLMAEQAVVVNDHRQGEPIRASGDRIDSDLVQRRAVLRGKPARVSQGVNALTGPEIRLDDTEGSAVVQGKGEMEFQTRRDLNGAELSRPRSVRINWTQGMDYRSRDGNAAINGDVRLVSGLDFMQCGNMMLLFDKIEPAAKPAEHVAKATVRQPQQLGIGIDKYSRRQIKTIYAEKGVMLRSERRDDQNRLQQAFQVTGDKLTYQAFDKAVSMEGHGELTVEDYLPPEPGKSEGDSGEFGKLDRPSQTVFKWEKSMEYSQEKRLVVMTGDVAMVHRSGQALAERSDLLEGIAHPDWPEKLPAGRQTGLTCEQLIAQFDQASESKPKDKSKPASPLGDEGPRVGPLEMFSATQDVSLEDGPRKLQGQRLLYNRKRDVAIVWGFLEGQPAATNATLIYEDPVSARSQSWSSPKITWDLKTNRIDTEAITGSGGK